MQSGSAALCASSDVAVFWDYENCHASSSVSGYQVVSGIRNVAHKYGSVKYFKAYMEVPDASAFSRALSLRSELQSSGVSVTDCPHIGRKDVADQMLMVDMLAYAIDHPTPATIILISGDRDFAYAVAVLRLRRYEVVAISTQAHSSLRNQASAWLDWNTHVLGYPISSSQHGCMEPSSRSTSSTVQQTPITRRPSYFGENSYTSKVEHKVEQAKLSPGRSVLEPPLVAPDQPEVVCAPAPAYIAKDPPPQFDVVDPPRGTGPLCPVPPHSAPEAEPEPAPLASPIRSFSETPLPSENDVPPRPGSSPAVLDRPPSLNLAASPGGADTILSTSLNHVQSLDAEVIPGTVSPPLSPSPAPPLASASPGVAETVLSTSLNHVRSLEPEVVPRTVSPSLSPPPVPPPASGSTPQTLPQTPPPEPDFTQPPLSPSAEAAHAPLQRVSIPPPPAAPPLTGDSLKKYRQVFRTLIEVLEKNRAKGVTKPLKSNVWFELFGLSKKVYEEAGVSNFSEFTALAEQVGIVEMGGSEGNAWISLRASQIMEYPPIASSSQLPSSSTATNVRKQPPQVLPAFQPLVDVLRKHRVQGVERLTKSVLSNELSPLSQSLYSRAGASTFKRFIALAEEAGVVEVGGAGNVAWVSLHQDLTDS